MSSSDTIDDTGVATAPGDEATIAASPAGAPVPAPARPKRHRGPNRPVVLVRTATVIVILIIMAELLLSPLSPYLPTGLLDQPREVAIKQQQLDRLVSTPPDVLFMGDSIMDSAGDAAIFSAASTRFDSAYNGALLGAPFAGQRSWLKRVVLPRVKPRVIVQMVSPLAVSAPEAEGRANVLDDNVDIEIDRADDSFWVGLDRSVSDVSYLVKYRHALRQPDVVVKAVQAMLKGDPPAAKPNVIRAKYSQPGYWDHAISPDGRYNDFNDLRMPAKFNASVIVPLMEVEPDFATFDQLLAFERDSGIAVVVVIAPIAYATYQASGVDMGRWRALADGVKARANIAGLPTIDLTDAGFVRTDFNDYLHMNDNGSRRLSTELARRLDALCAAGTLRCS